MGAYHANFALTKTNKHTGILFFCVHSQVCLWGGEHDQYGDHNHVIETPPVFYMSCDAPKKEWTSIT